VKTVKERLETLELLMEEIPEADSPAPYARIATHIIRELVMVVNKNRMLMGIEDKVVGIATEAVNEGDLVTVQGNFGEGPKFELKDVKWQKSY
jgi:hypothetical protein